MDIKSLIDKKRELEEVSKQLDEYCEALLVKKREIVDKIETITRESIAPLKEEGDVIDAELEKIMLESGTNKLSTDKYSAYLKEEISMKVLDPVKAYEWAKLHPSVLKKDILKRNEVVKLIDEGIVPDPVSNGIDCNETYKKITFRRK